MKKSPLFPLMGFLPLVMGFFYIRTAAFPLLGTLFFTALPWLMVALWLRAGWQAAGGCALPSWPTGRCCWWPPAPCGSLP